MQPTASTNYIHRLQRERDDALAETARLREGIRELWRYLQSDKFRPTEADGSDAIDSEMVNVRDVLLRTEHLR